MHGLLWLFSIVVANTAYAHQFVDVPGNHPYATGIHYARDQHIAEGYPDGTFRADLHINRAEFSKVVVGRMKEGGGTDCGLAWLLGNRPFSDVRIDDWFGPFVCVAWLQEIISGYPDRTFRPAAAINFVEAAKIVANVYGLPVTEADPWFKRYVIALEEKKAIPMSIASFDHLLTRGEMAEIIYRLEASVTDLPSKTFMEVQDSKTTSGASVVFVSSVHRSGGFSMDVPEQWITLEETFIGNLFEPERLSGTLFSDPASDLRVSAYGEDMHNTFFRVAMWTECLDITRIPLMKSGFQRTLTIDGRTFERVLMDEGSGGTRQEDVVYVARLGGSRCIVLTSSIRYINPDILSNPKEKAAEKRRLDATRELFDRMARSFRVVSGGIAVTDDFSEEKTYTQSGTVLHFKMPKEWSVKKVVGPARSGTGVPRAAPLWRLHLGPACKGCDGGADSYEYTIDAYASDPAVPAQLGSSPSIPSHSKYRNGDACVFVYMERGRCEDKNAFFITGGIDYKLSGRCAATDSLEFDQILQSMFVDVRKGAGCTLK